MNVVVILAMRETNIIMRHRTVCILYLYATSAAV